MQERTCRSPRADGTSCGARPLPGRDVCWAHAPELEQRRRQAKSEGGSNGATAARAQRLLPSQLRPVLHLLISGMDEVHKGELEPARLSAMAGAAAAITRLFGLVELESRLEALERTVSAHGR